MKNKVVKVIPRLYGLFFLIMGLNYFFKFIMLPQPSPEAMSFMMALSNTGYMFPLIGGLEIVTGVMLILNLWSALAVLLLAPLVVNIILLHVFLDPELLWLAVVVGALELFMAVIYWENFAHLFRRK